MDELLARAKRDGAPLIDGETVTFVWRGKRAPVLRGDWTGWESAPGIQLEQAAPNVWTHTMTLPRDAYIEYGYYRNDKFVPDPLNPRIITNGVGSYNNFFYMPEAAPTPLVKRMRGVPRGTVSTHVIKAQGLVYRDRRTVRLYQPPVDEPVPLVVVFDGQDYFRRAHLTTIVDNLIAERRMAPVALAMIDHGGPMRFVEYACGESVPGLLLTAVLPLAKHQLNLIDIEKAPGAYGVMGASMGGLLSLYVALRIPRIFGHVLSQSGAFSLDKYDMVVYDLVRDGSVHPLQIWMDCGRFEGLTETNERMHALLEAKGYDVAYNEYNGGHHYTAWHNDLWRGLELLFPHQT